MANVNRYVEGDKSVVLITVASAVTVEIGDLMFHDKADGIRLNGLSTSTYQGYPVEYLRYSGSSIEINKAILPDYFLGIALDDKDGISDGSDVKIPVATAGTFNIDLKPKRTVYVGEMLSASATTTASNLLNQKMAITSESSKAIAYVAESKSNAQDVDIFIRSYMNKI